ncbi:MAG: polymerase, sigma-24 subunit, subfamily [Paenibacillaceae bacterium]|jgi:RNA polymerase sigma-70 factor (ECF subfamily)|nr:polymerase, sigma-24 subunit, subfamily [Paenibacillaceae bacterium]
MPKTEEVWETFSRPLRHYIQQKVKDSHEADDILQEVFMRIHSSISTLKDGSKIRSWVYQITRNAICDYYRSKKNMYEIQDSMLDESADAAEAFMMRDLSRCVLEMINQMPDKYREALIMTEMYGMTQKELSIKLGISLPAAKSRVLRAREYMKNMILDCCELEFDRQGYIMDYKAKDIGYEKNLACCR